MKHDTKWPLFLLLTTAIHIFIYIYLKYFFQFQEKKKKKIDFFLTTWLAVILILQNAYQKNSIFTHSTYLIANM